MAWGSQAQSAFLDVPKATTKARPARYSVSFGSGENANATPSMQPSSIRPSVNSGSVAGRGSLNSLVGQATSKLREVATFQAEKRKTMRRLKKRKSSQESLQDMERRWVVLQALQWDAIGDAMKVQFVRSLRLARVLRGIRVMKLFRYVGALRMLGRR
eukprot:g4346.t1